MSTLINPYLPLSGHNTGPSNVDKDVHLEVPTLLEYRSEEDPDVEFIPKTVAGFGMGALLMGVGLDLCSTLLHPHAGPTDALFTEIVIRIVFIVGIIGVSSSLFLVGLKVRADRSPEPLYARHWLNSIGTGAGYALLVWLPWSLIDHSLPINRFVGAGLLMLLCAVPLLAARWTIGRHHHYS